ncbi:MAG: hypothetical protein HYX72_00455 [Acidobacteria bacterium]|nr:hypothetical protein [Acidobacteriota bacterium]
MIERSEFVFEGKVIKAESRLSPDRSKINTFFTFEIAEIIKGSYPADTIELSFLGGTVGDLSLVVSDMHFPESGEAGIYFVENLSRRQVHPFYGWDQGHFLIRRESGGADVVLTRSGRKITAIDSGVSKQEMGLTTGIALGVSINDRREKGLTPGEFKRKLREVLRETGGAQ